MNNSSDSVLTQVRAATHGKWDTQSALAQDLKGALMTRPTYDNLSASHREALEMICVKMSRIVCGNANEPDHWADIRGYALLAQNSIKE